MSDVDVVIFVVALLGFFGALGVAVWLVWIFTDNAPEGPTQQAPRPGDRTKTRGVFPMSAREKHICLGGPVYGDKIKPPTAGYNRKP